MISQVEFQILEVDTWTRTLFSADTGTFAVPLLMHVLIETQTIGVSRNISDRDAVTRISSIWKLHLVEMFWVSKKCIKNVCFCKNVFQGVKMIKKLLFSWTGWNFRNFTIIRFTVIFYVYCVVQFVRTYYLPFAYFVSSIQLWNYFKYMSVYIASF